MNMLPDWSPPEGSQPLAILTEASMDAREGRPELALSKLLWFHENALKIDPHVAGVRLSFALGFWHNLAQRFPPALEAMHAARDRAEELAFASSPVDFQRFHEFTAFNQILKEAGRTAKAFHRACQQDGHEASRVYNVAEPALVVAGDYAACNPFLETASRIREATQLYELQMSVHARQPFPEEILPRDFFTHEVATLVALLIRNNRPQDAREACELAFKILDDGEFRAALDSAMMGKLPVAKSDC